MAFVAATGEWFAMMVIDDACSRETAWAVRIVGWDEAGDLEIHPVVASEDTGVLVRASTLGTVLGITDAEDARSPNWQDRAKDHATEEAAREEELELARFNAAHMAERIAEEGIRELKTVLAEEQARALSSNKVRQTLRHLHLIEDSENGAWTVTAKGTLVLGVVNV